jgi:hypothetical protein
MRVPEEVENLKHILLFKSLKGNAARRETFNVIHYIFSVHKRSSGSGVNLYISTTQQRLEDKLLGFATWTQQNSSVALNHCTVHRQALASSKLHETLNEAVKAAYFTET